MTDGFRTTVYHVYWIENVPNYGYVNHTIMVTASWEFAKRHANGHISRYPESDVEIQAWAYGCDGMLWLKGTWND